MTLREESIKVLGFYPPDMKSREMWIDSNGGTEYELEELGEYCDDQLESIEASGYDISDTLYLTADGDSLPSPVYPGNVEVHCGEDH